MGVIIGNDFHSDPRIRKAKQQIMVTHHEYQKKIKHVSPPYPHMKEYYENLLKDFGKVRVGDLFLPYIGTGFGNGPLVELADGSVKYDMITGIGVHVFGHGHWPLMEVAIEAALGDTIMQGNLQQNEESFKLCQKLVDGANRSGGQISRCFLSTSGAMANENALKLIFHKNHPRQRLLAFSRCFMGRTLTLASITDKPAYRKNLPEWPTVDYIPFFDIRDPEGSEARAIEVLEQHLSDHPGEYAGMCFELILGEAGSYPGNKDFFIRLMDKLKEHDIAILVDEIQTFGRTREMFAFQLFGLDEYVDVVTVGKMSQVCATLFRETFKPPPGLISQTYTGATSGIQAALMIIDTIEKEFLGNEGKNFRLGNFFREELMDIAERHPDIMKGPFGLGSMLAFTVFDGDLEKNKAFIHTLYEKGIIAFLAGSNPSRIRFLPPMGVMEESHINDVCTILEAALADSDPS